MMKFAKRAISLLCVLSMIFSMVIISSAQSETIISVESQIIEQGAGTASVEVPIKISNNTGILGMTVSITFDSELTLIGAEQGSALGSLKLTKSKTFSNVPYKLVWDGEAAADTNDGVIATLTFEVPKETAKDYEINIVASGVFDGNVKPLYPTSVNGKITVEASQEEPASDTTISVESQTIEQGTGTEMVEVPIKISDNIGILGMTVSITFDSELTLVNNVQGSALGSLKLTTSKNFTDVPYKLVWDGEASADTNNGVIATLTFEVPKETAKDYAINIVASGVFDENVKPLYPTSVNGIISVIANEHNHSYGDWVKDNDDTHSKTCECGDVITEEHNWSAGVIESGMATYTCVSCSATKTETIEADAIFTLSDVVGKPGDTVEVKLSLKSNKEINSIAVSNINYDESILTFVGFSDYEHIEDITVLPPTFDEDKMAIVIGLKKATAFDGDICTLNFKIKDDISEECSTTINATSLAKKSSTLISSYMIPANVKVRLQLLGDIDCNETVDIDDAVALFQYSMLPEIYPIDYIGSVDFDKNGEVDIDDAILLFQYSMLPDIYPIE